MLVLSPAYIIIAVAVLVLNTQSENRHGRRLNKADGQRATSLFQDRSIVAAWTAAAIVMFAFVLFQVGIQIAGSELPVDVAGLRVLSFPPLLLTIAAVPLVRRLGVSMTARAGLLLITIGLSVAAITSRTTLILGVTTLTSGVALAIPGLIGIISSRAGDHNRGLALAIYSFVLFMGASLGPLAAQYLMKAGIINLCLLPAFLALIGFVAVQHFASKIGPADRKS